MLTAAEAREWFDYDPLTGDIFWKKARAQMKPGDPVGCLDDRGYHVTTWCRRRVYVHRIAWAIVHGEWPTSEIDHINRNKSDNRIANLRLATRAQNMRNRAHNGRCRRCKSGRWEAYLTVDYKYVYLGRHDTKEEAMAVSQRAAVEHSGVFAL